MKKFLNRLVVGFYDNAHLVLAALLFTAGSVALSRPLILGQTLSGALSGSLFGAGASLLGSWVTELRQRRKTKIDKEKSESNARRYLAAELNRTIERVIYIHQRADVNFVSASANTPSKPNDTKGDFIPFMPVLYPNAPQFRDLSGDDAVALIAFYDSLHALEKCVQEWWGRPGQLPVNIYNGIRHHANDSLVLAKECIVRFDLEKLFPPKYASWPPLAEKLEAALSSAEKSMQAHLDRSSKKMQQIGKVET